MNYRAVITRKDQPGFIYALDADSFREATLEVEQKLLRDGINRQDLWAIEIQSFAKPVG